MTYSKCTLNGWRKYFWFLATMWMVESESSQRGLGQGWGRGKSCTPCQTSYLYVKIAQRSIKSNLATLMFRQLEGTCWEGLFHHTYRSETQHRDPLEVNPRLPSTATTLPDISLSHHIWTAERLVVITGGMWIDKRLGTKWHWISESCSTSLIGSLSDILHSIMDIHVLTFGMSIIKYNSFLSSDLLQKMNIFLMVCYKEYMWL